ncbi:hypothetical protein BYT27DRAFT_7203679 [Phlegmacium glaucopus]|nr:hypothetical protein BYT27DRAFT_7203679 [Phlegmacium glaucopus]
MSRLTSAQVISLGEYLGPDFDPNSLTVSQLLGVLGYHNVRYPTPYTKTKLVQLFNTEIKSRASKFKKERLKKENSIASDDGITDGLTGEPLNKGKAKALGPVPRRSSRRLSQVPSTAETSPTRPDPPKRRRSSAQPTFGGKSQKVLIGEATVHEESEPEEDLPITKVSRKKLTSAGTQARRVSHVSGEESGWEDNNIFQSGAESSSPIRPSPVRPRTSRHSGSLRKSRKSMSAPPQMLESSSPVRPLHLPDYISRSPPQSPFRPSLPPIPTFNKLHQPSSSRQSPMPEFKPMIHTRSPKDGDTPTEEPAVDPVHANMKQDSVGPYSDNDSVFALAASREMTEHVTHVQLHSSAESGGLNVMQIIARAIIWLFILFTGYSVLQYKLESSAIGFCDTGSNSSKALQELLVKRLAIDECIRETAVHNSSEVEQGAISDPCPLKPLVPLPHPKSCTPCPEHASCGQFNVFCDSGYLLKPNLLLSFIPVKPSSSELSTKHAPYLAELFFQTVSAVTDGFPGFGSVGLPPRCIEDPQRRRNIGSLGKAIESSLAKERGRRVCLGDNIDDKNSPEDAMRWGVEVENLREVFRKKTTPSLLPVFDDMFNEAIRQLIQWGGVYINESSDGLRYVAHKTPEMTWDCIIAVKSGELWAIWRTTVLASISTIVAALCSLYLFTQRQKESRRIAGLVQVALDTLRNQEFAHYTDPLNAPQPYLSSIQLRDLVLQGETSVHTRRRLWERVERIVESNANVRANLEEIEGGDETRVWRWVGSTGRTPGRRSND